MVVAFLLNAFGQFLILIIFLLTFVRRRLSFIIPIIIHIAASLICYEFDFQPWTILLIIGAWLVSGIWIFLLRWDIELKQRLKIALVVTVIVHGLTWADAWYERLIMAGWYGYNVQHFEINEDYSIRVYKISFSRFISVHLVNKSAPVQQKIKSLPLDGSIFPIDDVKWIPLEQDSVMITIESVSYSDGLETDNCTIYLPDY